MIVQIYFILLEIVIRDRNELGEREQNENKCK
jgi:hypothetical protein